MATPAGPAPPDFSVEWLLLSQNSEATVRKALTAGVSFNAMFAVSGKDVNGNCADNTFRTISYG